MAGGVYKDVWLVGCQYASGKPIKIIAYSLEISVDHVAGVEVIKAFRDIRCLVRG